MSIRERCWITKEWIDEMGKYGDCGECHCMSCQVKTGFEPGPERVHVDDGRDETEEEAVHIRERCWATGEWIDEMGEYGNCYECHCMSCPVKTGFEPGPEKVVID